MSWEFLNTLSSVISVCDLQTGKLPGGLSLDQRRRSEQHWSRLGWGREATEGFRVRGQVIRTALSAVTDGDAHDGPEREQPAQKG